MTAASTEFAAAGAASRSTAAVFDLDQDDDEDEDYEEDDDGDDSVVLVGKKPAARPPPEKMAPFQCVSGDVLRVMQDRLNSNASKHNVVSSSHATLKTILSSLVESRGDLVKIANELDKRMVVEGDGEPITIATLLLQALPDAVSKRGSSKAAITEIFVKTWAVISGIVANFTFGRKLTHQLAAYLSLMGRLELTAFHAISEANKVDANCKSIKLSGQDLHRMMLEDQGSRPICALSSCAMCGHCLVDEPFSNRESARLNKITRDGWARDHAKFEEYSKSGRDPLLDKNGKVVTKHRNPTLLPELLVCHCWQNKHEAFVGGKKCFYGCVDPKTKTQFKSGTCPVCVCLCHFVCTKE